MVGHHSNTPNLPGIRSIPDPRPHVAHLLPLGTAYYRMGKCKIMVCPPTPKDGWYMSIHCDDRYPTWDEVAKARYQLLPTNMDFCMLLPKPEDYINDREFNFIIKEHGLPNQSAHSQSAPAPQQSTS